MPSIPHTFFFRGKSVRHDSNFQRTADRHAYFTWPFWENIPYGVDWQGTVLPAREERCQGSSIFEFLVFFSKNERGWPAFFNCSISSEIHWVLRILRFSSSPLKDFYRGHSQVMHIFSIQFSQNFTASHSPWNNSLNNMLFYVQSQGLLSLARCDTCPPQQLSEALLLVFVLVSIPHFKSQTQQKDPLMPHFFVWRTPNLFCHCLELILITTIILIIQSVKKVVITLEMHGDKQIIDWRIQK